MPNYAVIVAAGKGRRFGSEKQFYQFHGLPLVVHSLLPFVKSRKIDEIIVVVPRRKVKYMAKFLASARVRITCTVVAGGRRRQDSVANALRTIRSRSGIVVIHDGVRPMVTEHLIHNGILLCRKYGAVVYGLPITDTLKQVKRHVVTRTVPRRHLYSVQTPQFFKTSVIKDAYKMADLSHEFTDDAAVLESLEVPVYLFKGDPSNIKITKKSDLSLLEKCR